VCGVSQMCVIVKRRKMRRPRPPRGCRAVGEKKCTLLTVISGFRRDGDKICALLGADLIYSLVFLGLCNGYINITDCRGWHKSHLTLYV
jgi:hypothetical protein